MDRQLAGKAAVVTGSTSGIGKGIAECFARAGANVMLNGFGDAAAIEALRSGLEKQHGVRALYHGADMARPAEIRALVQAAESEYGAVDILVNNAGIQHVAPIEAFPDERWDAILAVNLSSAFHATKAVLPGMQRRKSGAASSTSRRPTGWSHRRTRAPTWPPSTGSSDSPRSPRWRTPRGASA